MPPSASSTHLSPAELSYLHTSLSSHPPLRPDSRHATDFRPLNAETGILPNTMGSAHVGFADGREAVVGVRAEVEKSSRRPGFDSETKEEPGQDVEMVDSAGQIKGRARRGQPEWITLSLTLPGMRDDDKDLVFLEEMLRETLIAGSGSNSNAAHTSTTTEAFPPAQSLRDALVINHRYHWHLFIDVLLISAPDHAISTSTSTGGGSGSGTSSTFPLPLLSMAIHLALRDTKIPRLKSEGDEDPVADDDWDAAVDLYARGHTGKTRKSALLETGLVPPVTLLVMVVAENVIFDPSPIELAIADGVLAVTVGRTGASSGKVGVMAVRTLESMARDTMKGVPRDALLVDAGVAVGKGNGVTLTGSDAVVPGVWKPKVGGIKRTVLMAVVKSVVGGGVGNDVLTALEGFLDRP